MYFVKFCVEHGILEDGLTALEKRKFLPSIQLVRKIRSKLDSLDRGDVDEF